MQPDIFEYNHRGLEYVNLLLTSQSLGRRPTHPLRHSIRAPPPFQSPFITRSFVYYVGIIEKRIASEKMAEILGQQALIRSPRNMRQLKIPLGGKKNPLFEVLFTAI